MGMVDGILAEASGGAPPRIVALESGAPVLARRLHPRLEAAVRGFGRRFGVRRGRICRFPWRAVTEHEIEVVLDRDAGGSPTLAWERRLRALIDRVSLRALLAAFGRGRARRAGTGQAPRAGGGR